MACDDPAISVWLEGLKTGDSKSAQRLHQVVYERLVRLSKKQLGGYWPRWFDEDDIAISAFRSFCRRAEEGEFSRLNSRDDFWRLLGRIIYCKARNYFRKDFAQKRGAGQTRTDSAGLENGAEAGSGNLALAADSIPAPDVALILAEECQRLLHALEDETLAQIAIWKVDGFTDAEIAFVLTVLRAR